MSKEKQIEEMAELFSKFCEDELGADFIKDIAVDFAERLYNAGYREQSEVAREIFEDIEREIKNHGITYAQRKIAKLKKKYTEGKTDENISD